MQELLSNDQSIRTSMHSSVRAKLKAKIPPDCIFDKTYKLFIPAPSRTVEEYVIMKLAEDSYSEIDKENLTCYIQQSLVACRSNIR